jgi:hypothetical protein
MANQYTAIVEEATRGTNPGSGYKFPPTTGKIEPQTEFKDEPRSEYRGQNTRLGNLTVVRKSTSVKHDLEMFLYPIDIVGTLFKHALGYAGNRSVLDTSAYKGIIYPPEAFHYGNGGNLAGKGLTVIPNTDNDGVTKAQIFRGFRVKGFKLEFKRPEDVKITFNLMSGPWVGAPGQTATAGASFTTLVPYNSDDLVCYSGAGITRTGTGPNFTEIAPNTMLQFVPDDLTLTWDSAIEDTDVLDGLSGPSKTEAKGQAKATLEFGIDFSDPASGFSSFDEWVALHSAVRTMNFLLALTSPNLAGAATQYHEHRFDLPNMQMIGAPPERDNTGKTPKFKAKYESLFDSTCQYPMAIWAIDKVSAY